MAFSGRQQDTSLSTPFRSGRKLVSETSGVSELEKLSSLLRVWLDERGQGTCSDYSHALRWQCVFVTLWFCFLPSDSNKEVGEASSSINHCGRLIKTKGHFAGYQPFVSTFMITQLFYQPNQNSLIFPARSLSLATHQKQVSSTCCLCLN